MAAQVVVGCLIAFYVLLPLDLGFPTVPLLGHPLSPAIAATVVVLAVLVIKSNGGVLSYLVEPYSVVQSAYCLFLVLSALASVSPPSALHAALLYYSTFVLNYAILRYVTRAYGVRWLSVLVVWTGLLAAGVGIARGVFGLSLPIYDRWFQQYFRIEAQDYARATTRAVGTMNNEILYGVLMVLVLPYAFDLKSPRRRALAVSALLLAAGFSGSRTILTAVIFGAGALAVYRWRTLWVLSYACVGLLFLLASFGLGGTTGGDSRVDFLLQRAGLTAESNAVVAAAAEGINVRREVFIQAAREMSQWEDLTWIVGRGYYSAASVAQRASLTYRYTTLDNVFLTVLYEGGILGLVLFLGAGLTFLLRTRRAATMTLHWYAPLVLALSGISFSWSAYSTFNILAVGSMAIAMWHEELARRRSAQLHGTEGSEFRVR